MKNCVLREKLERSFKGNFSKGGKLLKIFLKLFLSKIERN
jgi:hypothetical protein